MRLTGPRQGHELLCLSLELRGFYNQLDLSCLAGAETFARRLQLTEELNAVGGAAANWGARFFVGFRRGTTAVALYLAKYVTEEPRGEGSVMEERRKHAVERKVAREEPPGGGRDGT